MVCRTLSGCANLNTTLSRFKARLMHFVKAPQVISGLMPAELKKKTTSEGFLFLSGYSKELKLFLLRFHNYLTGKLIVY